MSVELRPINPDELEPYMHQISLAFGGRRAPVDAIERAAATTELERSLAAFDGGRLVATAGILTFEVGLPGGVTAPAAGVSRVTVAPSHRRQGILTAIMRRQLDDIHEMGEPLALLYASEAGIYGRFGYGVATWHAAHTIARSRSAFAEPVRPRVALVPGEEAAASLHAFHNAQVGRQPGLVTRTEQYWKMLAADAPSPFASGGGERRFGLHHAGAEVDGFVIFRTHSKWEGREPEGTVEVEMLMAAGAQAHAELWRFCLDVDLMTGLRAAGRPQPEPLRLLLADPRALRVQVDDGLWARLVDAPAALAARRYATEGRIVLEVEDGFCPWNAGRWELSAGPDGADCRSTSAEPDLTVSAADLAACYLGSNRFGDLLTLGRIAGRPGAAERADAMFASYPEAWCPTFF